jgi:hypothetical protein
MAYIDQYALGENVTFQQTVQVAMMTAAVLVLGEVLGTSDATTYQKRQLLANQVLANPQSLSVKFARMLATVPTVLITTPDATLLADIQTNWNKVAGVNVND